MKTRMRQAALLDASQLMDRLVHNRLALTCFADDDDTGDGGGGGGGGDDKLAAVTKTKDRAVQEAKDARAQVKDLQKKLDAFNAAQAAAEEEAAKKRGEFDKINAQKDEQIATLKGQVNNLITDNALSKALGDVAILPEAREFIEAKFRSDVTVEDGAATIQGKSVSDFVGEWAKSDGAKHFIVSKASGGGASPGNQGGPTGEVQGNVGGTSQERAAYFASKFPDLKK